MTTEHDKQTPQEAGANSKVTGIKLNAQATIGAHPKRTSSWAILRELKISIVDGGVNILKRGYSRLTGAAQPTQKESSSGPRQRTSSWAILKELKVSIIDGGVNILRHGSFTDRVAMTPEETSGEAPKHTSSWAILKDLKLSVVDGGLNILRQGISKVTGTIRGMDPSEAAMHPSTAEISLAQSKAAIGIDDQDNIGGDWIDNLLAELDASVLSAEEAEPLESGPAQNSNGSLGPAHSQTSTQSSHPLSERASEAVILRPGGSEWRREGSAWYEYKAGKLTGEVMLAELEFQPAGEIVFTNAAGELLEIWRPGDGRVKIRDDKPEITRDDSNNVIMQTYASCDGALPATYKFQDSQLVEAQTADGNVWKRAEEGKWQLYSGPPQDLELRLSESGDCVIFKNGEIVAIKHRQGLDIEFKYTGEREIKKNEKVIEIVYPDGSFVTLNAASPGITDEDDQSSQQSEMRLGM